MSINYTASQLDFFGSAALKTLSNSSDGSVLSLAKSFSEEGAYIKPEISLDGTYKITIKYFSNVENASSLKIVVNESKSFILETPSLDGASSVVVDLFAGQNLISIKSERHEVLVDSVSIESTTDLKTTEINDVILKINEIPFSRGEISFLTFDTNKGTLIFSKESLSSNKVETAISIDPYPNFIIIDDGQEVLNKKSLTECFAEINYEQFFGLEKKVSGISF